MLKRKMRVLITRIENIGLLCGDLDACRALAGLKTSEERLRETCPHLFLDDGEGYQEGRKYAKKIRLNNEGCVA